MGKKKRPTYTAEFKGEAARLAGLICSPEPSRTATHPARKAPVRFDSSSSEESISRHPPQMPPTCSVQPNRLPTYSSSR